MTETKKGSLPTTPRTPTDTNVDNTKDLTKVYEYFQYKVGTSLDCAIATKVLRNSITYYIDYLLKEHLLQAIYKKSDRTTGYAANHYSADPKHWTKKDNQLNIWGGIEQWHQQH